MIEVVSIKFKNRGKSYYFSPNKLDIKTQLDAKHLHARLRVFQRPLDAIRLCRDYRAARAVCGVGLARPRSGKRRNFATSPALRISRAPKCRVMHPRPQKV